jgi:hypothetical protein
MRVKIGLSTNLNGPHVFFNLEFFRRTEFGLVDVKSRTTVLTSF